MSDGFTNFPHGIGTNGTEWTPTATRINYLGATPGTGEASTVAMLNAGEDFTWPATGILTYGVLKDPAATTIGATGAEINYVDITTLGTGAASKAVVLDAGDDYTWPATGILTYGVLKDPAATTIGSTGAEINYVDITTLGTGAASKTAVLDAGEDFIWPATGILTYGVLKDPAATTIVATAAEMNRAFDVSTRVVTLTATGAITEANHEGKVLIMGEVGGDAAATFTLPAATSVGATYRFVVGVVNTSNYAIVAASAADIFQGTLLTNSSSDVAADQAQAWTTAADSDTLTLNATTQGGVTKGDWVEFVNILANVWAVTGLTTSSGTEITPFSAAV